MTNYYTFANEIALKKCAFSLKQIHFTNQLRNIARTLFIHVLNIFIF